MKPAFYTGASGLIAFQSRLDVVGNNISNVNTTFVRSFRAILLNSLLLREMYSVIWSIFISFYRQTVRW